jgi:hypothetical protein
MKYLLFVIGLGLAWMGSCAQVVDSSKRKSCFPERLNERLTELLIRRQEAMIVRRQERMEEIERRPYRKSDSSRWSLSLNPFSVLDLQGAAGLGVGYRVDHHWQVWLESAALFQLYPGTAQSCLGGIREILAVKYYFGYRESLFFSGEFRYKDVYYHDVANFNDNVNMMPVYGYTYKLENIVFGGAAWFGGQIRLSNDHRWRLEPSIGLGTKGRTVIWHGVPAGYTYQKQVGLHEWVDPNSARTSTPADIYLPATVRLVYVL